MNLFASLRYLRHGPLRKLSPLWLTLGRSYRSATNRLNLNFKVPHFIGPYGPFDMLAEFAFSDFASWGEKHNRGFTRCIEACRTKACALDIGAHIGLVTMPMSKAIGPQGQVFAFEPSSANRKALSRHILLNDLKNVTVVDRLLGDKVQRDVSFYEHSSVSGMNSCTPLKSGEDYEKVFHHQTTIDDFCLKDDIHPDIIKIDVEGWELSVLEGSKRILQTARPLIFLSVHPQHLESLGRSASELWDLLEKFNYGITDIAGDTIKCFKLDEYILEPKDNAPPHR